VYEHDEDCVDAMKGELPIPEIPEKPMVHEKILVNTIRKFLS
jgi:hypothetical protein